MASPSISTNGAMLSKFLRIPGFRETFEKSPEVARAFQQAQQSGQEVQTRVGSQNVWVGPNGNISFSSPGADRFATGLKVAGFFMGGMAGAQAFGLMGGGGAGASSGATGGAGTGTGVGIGETGATTGLSGPIAGMSTIDPITGVATLPSAATAATASTGLPGGTGSGTAQAARSGSSFGSKVANIAKTYFGGKKGDAIAAIAKGVGSLGKGQTDERERRDDTQNVFTSRADAIDSRSQTDFDQLRLAGQNDFDKLRLEAAANRRTDESDAWKKLQYAEYMNNNAHAYSPVKTQSGVQLGDYGFGPYNPTANERAGASTLSQQMLARLQPGGSFEPTPMFQPTAMFKAQRTPQITEPSTTEKVMGVGSTIAEILATLAKSRSTNV